MVGTGDFGSTGVKRVFFGCTAAQAHFIVRQFYASVGYDNVFCGFGV